MHLVRPAHLTARRSEHTAARVSRGEFDIRFTGWLGPSERSAAFAEVDLLVVPSLWPEPFGLVGPEAASAGVPALAFDVGGIREWLTDSVNGRLVPPAPDAAGTLAHAIRDCLSDPARLQRWGAQALADSQTRTLTSHVDSLEDVLAGAATRRAGSHAAERVHEASATGA